MAPIHSFLDRSPFHKSSRVREEQGCTGERLPSTHLWTASPLSTKPHIEHVPPHGWAPGLCPGFGGGSKGWATSLPSTPYVLTHAWLSHWGKHMTTSRTMTAVLWIHTSGLSENGQAYPPFAALNRGKTVAGGTRGGRVGEGGVAGGG